LVIVLAAGVGVTPPAPVEMAVESEAALTRDCDAGKMPACARLGDLHASGRAAQPDLHRAETLWTRACDRGQLAACVSLGQLLWSGWAPTALESYRDGARAGKPIRPDPRQATRLFTRACDAKLAPGCVAWARTLVNEAGTPSAKGCELFARGCTLGDESACAERSSRCRTVVRVASGKPELWTGALAASGDGVLLTESLQLGPQAAGLRLARMDLAGRVKPLGTVANAFWQIAPCPDGKSAWLVTAQSTVFFDGTATAEIPLPAIPKEAQQGTAVSPLACLPDGSVAVVRSIPGVKPTDADYRAFFDRAPDRLSEPETATVQTLTLSVYEYTRPHEVAEVRALAAGLAADLRRGVAFLDVVARAKQAWYAVESVDHTVSERSMRLPYLPPDEAARLSVGGVLGPVEQLEPVQRGRHARVKGAFKIWRVAARKPAHVPTFAEARAAIQAQYAASAAELFVIARDGIRAQRRTVTFNAGNGLGDETLGPAVPIDDGLLLLGADRGQLGPKGWTGESPLLAALRPLRIRDAVRDRDRIALLIDDEPRRMGSARSIRVVGVDGRLIQSTPVTNAEGGSLYPGHLGLCGVDRFCAVATDLDRAWVITFDRQGKKMSTDLVGFMGGGGISFSTMGVWMVSHRGGAILRYSGRQTTVYNLVEHPW
jgi:hypothetical protein